MKKQQYKDLEGQVKELLVESRHWVTNTANVSSIVYHELKQVFKVPVNWVGFYLKTTPGQDQEDTSLYLGPFQGEIACVSIPNGKGVCGKAAKDRATVLVPNVHEFPGHIACSPKTNSEIVIPMVKDGVLIGVFDLDALELNSFDEDDRVGLESIVNLVIQGCDWPQ